MADNAALVARIVDAYKKATLKAHYDMLKEYKQGLLIDADVDEKIEIYEDSLTEAGASSSAPATAIRPTSNEPRPIPIEPLSNVNPSKDQETQQ